MHKSYIKRQWIQYSEEEFEALQDAVNEFFPGDSRKMSDLIKIFAMRYLEDLKDGS